MLAVHPNTLTPAQAIGAIHTHGLGLIGDVISARLIRRLNGDTTLRVEAVATEHNLSLIMADRLICYNGQLYRIQRPGRSNARGRHSIRAEAQHILYDLVHTTIVNIETKEDPATPDGIEAGIALGQVLSGTPFTVGTVDVDMRLDYLDILRASCLDGIRQVVETWGGELEIDNWTISLRKQLGQDRGVSLRYGSNIDGIDIQEDYDPVVTRLHAYGYEVTNFESINNGLDYIDSEDIGLYANIREAYVNFDDVDDPEELLRLAKEHLAEVEKPQITIRPNLLALRGSPYWGHYAVLDTMHIGDTVETISDDIGVRITARVQETEIDCLTGDIISLQLGNAKADLLLRSIAEAHTASKQAQKEVKLVSAETARQRQILNVATIQLAEAKQRIADAELEIIDAQVVIAEATERLTGIDGIVTQQGIEINQLDDELQSKASKTELNALEGVVTDQSTSISQNAELIAQKADKTVVDSLSGTVDKQGTAITQSAELIAQKADKTVVDSLSGTVDAQGTAITQSAELIAQKADKELVDTLSQTVTNHGTAITQHAEDIALKADATVVDAMGQVVVNQGTAINQNAKEIILKANRTDVDVIAQTVSEQSSVIAQMPDSITLAVNNMQIGGRNLWQNTGFLNGNIGEWVVGGGATAVVLASDTITTAYEGLCLRALMPQATAWAYVLRRASGLRIGTQYTVSFWMKNTAPVMVKVANNNGYVDVPAGSDWKRFVATFTAAAEMESFIIYSVSMPNYSYYVYVDNEMLETGNKASAWSLSPEELVNSAVIIDNKGIVIRTNGAFNAIGGSGANSFGLSTDNAANYFLWAGHADPALAPFAIMRDGTMRNGANMYVMTFEDDCSPAKPMQMPMYFPEELAAIGHILLSYSISPLRSTTTGAAAGGGTVVTSRDGGASTQTSSSGGGLLSGSTFDQTFYTDYYEGSTSNPSTATTSQHAGHGHNVTGSTTTQNGSHTHTLSHTHDMTHRHYNPAHRHGIEMNSHSHSISIPAHSHTVDIPEHAHALVYGIYEATTKASTTQVWVDGLHRLTLTGDQTHVSLNGRFNATNGRITRNVQHMIELLPNALTRIRVQVTVIGAIVTKTIGSM